MFRYSHRPIVIDIVCMTVAVHAQRVGTFVARLAGTEFDGTLFFFVKINHEAE